ncbi:MAG: hypothetical protein EP335_09725 [Alphaproteobacteria bacterium]|nr:MAG: hypothetical protein EP335_09725 [Alphaproteobacteria bacterium]
MTKPMEIQEIEAVLAKIEPGRPLLILDADEVLLRFVERLEQHLNDNGFDLRLTSFRLSGNIFHRESGDRADLETCRGLIASFFDTCAHDVPAVEGAAETLAALSDRFQIVVLTNVPERSRMRRIESLRAQGIDYPLIANAGEKGPMARRLMDRAGAISVFVDDLPPQLLSVAEHAPDMHLVHFVADPRLGPLIEPAEAAHVRIDDWPRLGRHLTALLDD